MPFPQVFQVKMTFKSNHDSYVYDDSSLTHYYDVILFSGWNDGSHDQFACCLSILRNLYEKWRFFSRAVSLSKFSLLKNHDDRVFNSLSTGNFRFCLSYQVSSKKCNN